MKDTAKQETNSLYRTLDGCRTRKYHGPLSIGERYRAGFTHEIVVPPSYQHLAYLTAKYLPQGEGVMEKWRTLRTSQHVHTHETLKSYSLNKFVAPTENTQHSSTQSKISVFMSHHLSQMTSHSGTEST